MSCRYTAQGRYICDAKDDKHSSSQVEHFLACQTGCDNSSYYTPFTLGNKQKVNIPKVCTCTKQGDVSIANCSCPTYNKDTKEFELRKFQQYAVPKDCRNKGYVRYDDNTMKFECNNKAKGHGPCDGFPMAGEKYRAFEARTDCYWDEATKKRTLQSYEQLDKRAR
jgi:hypothetical protein